MDLDIVKSIAAFGGLGLGLINLWILVHKEYLRKPKLAIYTKRALVRVEDYDTFDIQIDFEAVSEWGDIYIKEIVFSNEIPVFDPINDKGTRVIYELVDYPGYDALEKGGDDFKGLYDKLFKNSLAATNLKISSGEHKSLSIIDRIVTERYMDGPWEWPLKNWSFKITSSVGVVTVPFDFVGHKSSKVHYTK